VDSESAVAGAGERLLLEDGGNTKGLVDEVRIVGLGEALRVAADGVVEGAAEDAPLSPREVAVMDYRRRKRGADGVCS